MHLDMANFTLQIIRPDIINHSVELEREKFAKYLEVQAGKTNSKSLEGIFDSLSRWLGTDAKLASPPHTDRTATSNQRGI